MGDLKTGAPPPIKLLLDGHKFVYHRLETVLTAGAIDDQSRARITEARDTIVDTLGHVLGRAMAEKVLSVPDSYRVDAPHARRDEA